MSEFDKLVRIIKNFPVNETIRDERELEANLEKYLKDVFLTSSFELERQKITGNVRNDLVVIAGNKKFCIELKKFTDVSVASQIDRYLPLYKDGVILVCWKCSQTLRDVFNDVKKQIRIPIEVIELRKYQAII